MMRVHYAIGACAVLLAAAGCTDGGDDTSAECQNQIIETFPANGDTQAYYRTTVEVLFAKAEADATATLLDASGGTVATSSTWLNNRLVLTPSTDLAPSSDYSIRISYSCGEPETAFRTNELGTAVDSELTGRSYVLDLESARFVEPEGVGSLLGQYLETDILIGVKSLVDDELVMMGAIGVDGAVPPAQEPCDPSISFDENPAVYDNPHFEIGPADTTLSVQDFTIALKDLFISGDFAPDGSYFGGGKLAGSADTRDFLDLVDADPTNPEEWSAICDLAEAIGVTCAECAPNPNFDNQGGPYCLSLKVDSIVALEVPGLTLTPIDDPCLLEECAEDPACVQE